jgi:hypothetical protein
MASLPSYLLDLSKEHVTSVFRKGDEPVVDHPLDADEEVLIALGYRQDFKRKFTVWSSFCVSFSVLGLLPSVAATLAYSLGYEPSADLLIQICWHRGNGLGMDYCEYHDSIRCCLHGRTLF